MQDGVRRRSLLRHLFAAPFIASPWKAGPPTAYLAELERLMRAASLPGAVIGCIQARKTAWIAPLGIQAANAPARVRPSTLFQAASLTKQVTAYAAFALRTQGKLDFDKPLVHYIDDLPNPAARQVTARHVLSHTSGFPNWRYVEPPRPVPDLVPGFEPGSKFQYSGEGYFYLQRVMEQVTGIGFGQLIRNLVFEPLQMKSSTLVWDPETLPHTAQPHDRRGELRQGWEKSVRAFRAWAAHAGKTVDRMMYADYAAAVREAGGPLLPDRIRPNAASSLVTSAEDYARFVSAAIGQSEIAEQQVAINEFLGWGLGWAIERTAGRTFVWQWGDNPGYKNFVMAEPSSGNAIFVFTNGDSGARTYDRVLTHATGMDHPALFWL